jgi:hypothetical protein
MVIIDDLSNAICLEKRCLESLMAIIGPCVPAGQRMSA